MSATTGRIVLHAGEGRWLRFQRPLDIIAVSDVAGVRPALERIARRVDEDGLYAAGFIAYEAAPAFDPALRTRPAGPLPLLWFGIYHPPEVLYHPGSSDAGAFQLGSWQPSVGESEYDRAFQSIKAHIARGDTYQVNYTYRLRAPFAGSPWDFFLQLAEAQEARYTAYLDGGRFAICSASPELFFHLSGSKLTCLPMKGTAPRGLTLEADRRQMSWLHQSEKNRAENLMIVDMIRNDLGRIASFGSVHVPDLFQIERYPTILQMISTVTARSPAALPDILGALFPCASITGAPKVRTMEIIADLESSPRGVYTGCVGYLAPGRQARFSVAIRTVAIDRQRGEAEYGIGGGIVWDSDCGDELREARLKARVLTTSRPAFNLLETLLWEPESGYFLLAEHLERLARSAEYFGYPVDVPAVRRLLLHRSVSFAHSPRKVRLLVNRHGLARLEVSGRKEWPPPPARLGLAAQAVDSSSPFLYHKTTRRQIYRAARAASPGCDEVILWNERGLLTETTRANLVLKLGGHLVTPPVECGLLAGTFRQHLIASGQIQEAKLPTQTLEEAEALYLINSVHRWRTGIWTPQRSHGGNS